MIQSTNKVNLFDKCILKRIRITSQFYIFKSGRLSVHVVHYQNPWIEKALCFVEYLTKNQKAFDKYRIVKVEGAKLQSDIAEKGSFFLKKVTH